jgi:magnesium transporter
MLCILLVAPLAGGLRPSTFFLSPRNPRKTVPVLRGDQTVLEHIAENPTMHASREVVVDAKSTVAETVASIRAAADRVSEVGRVWVSTGGAISGYVGASELLLAAPDHGIAGLAQPTETILRDDESLDDALSRVVMLGGSGALPVVDGDGALVGALTPSEIMVELERDATEDVSRMAGTGTTESYFGAKIRDLVVSRGAWLLALLVLQSGSSVVLTKFSALLERHLALALFLTMSFFSRGVPHRSARVPVSFFRLTGTAGNAGNQTSALVIRGLATGEIDARRDWRRVLFREAKVAAPLAAILGLASFGRVATALAGAHAARTALVVATAMTTTVVAAIVVGVGAPLLLEAAGVDPCNCASPALATAVDLLGVVVLCSLGKALLPLPA